MDFASWLPMARLFQAPAPVAPGRKSSRGPGFPLLRAMPRTRGARLAPGETGAMAVNSSFRATLAVSRWPLTESARLL